MHFVLFRGGLLHRQWYWRLRAKNGRRIAVSGEGYHNKMDALRAIDLVMQADSAEIREQA